MKNCFLMFLNSSGYSLEAFEPSFLLSERNFKNCLVIYHPLNSSRSSRISGFMSLSLSRANRFWVVRSYFAPSESRIRTTSVFPRMIAVSRGVRSYPERCSRLAPRFRSCFTISTLLKWQALKSGVSPSYKFIYWLGKFSYIRGFVRIGTLTQKKIYYIMEALRGSEDQHSIVIVLLHWEKFVSLNRPINFFDLI